MSGRERCGCWVEIGGYETVCMLWDDHDGDCQPERQELLNHANRLADDEGALRRHIARVDAFGRWPFPTTATPSPPRSDPEGSCSGVSG